MNTENDTEASPDPGNEPGGEAVRRRRVLGPKLVFTPRVNPVPPDQAPSMIKGRFWQLAIGLALFAVVALAILAGVSNWDRPAPIAREAPASKSPVPSDSPVATEPTASDEPQPDLREAARVAVVARDWAAADRAYQGLFAEMDAAGVETPLDLLSEHGMVLLLQGKRKQSLTVFGKIVSRDEKWANGGALNNYAFLLGHTGGDLPQALAAVEKALALDPGNPDFLHTKGTLLLRSERSGEAIAVLEQAIRLTPPGKLEAQWDFHDALGDAYYKDGNLEKALLNWRRAAADAPMNGKLWQKIKRFDP